MRRSGASVIFSGQNKDKVSYCDNCSQVGMLSPLKHRIYLDENGKITNQGPDDKNWLQCWKCGLVVGVYEAKQEADIETLTEPRDNPFKFKNAEVKTGESRKFDRTGKTQHKRRFKQDLEQYKEEDIKDALGKGAKLLSYEEH